MRIDRTKFAGHQDLIRHLVEKKDEIIELKKAVSKFTDEMSVSLINADVKKALTTSYKDDPASGVIKRSIIANTYNWMDSHNDVHLNGVFKKSISGRPIDKIFHLADHEFKTTSRVGKFFNLEEKRVQWNQLGVSKFGYTEVLFAESDIMQEMHPAMFKAYLRGEIDQHSVGMQYVHLSLAVNDPEYKEEFANWNEYRPMLGNGEKADEIGFFWAVKEAKLKEISAVLEGSNELTPTLENKLDPAAASRENGSDHFEAHKQSILHYY
jgi:hypothetical protein